MSNTVPVNTASMRTAQTEQGYDAGGLDRVCGTCGLIIAPGHVAQHVAWHGAAWGSPTVVPDASITGNPINA